MHMKKIFSLASALILAATFLSVQPAPARAADSAAAMEAYEAFINRVKGEVVAADFAAAMGAYKAVLQNKTTFFSTNDKKIVR